MTMVFMGYDDSWIVAIDILAYDDGCIGQKNRRRNTAVYYIAVYIQIVQLTNT